MDFGFHFEGAMKKIGSVWTDWRRYYLKFGLLLLTWTMREDSSQGVVHKRGFVVPGGLMREF